MSRLTLILLMLAGNALAAEADKTVILTPPGSGTTIGKIDGQPLLLKKIPNGTVGKIGQDKVILQNDGRGNTIGKIGKDKVFCHSDPASGLTICK